MALTDNARTRLGAELDNLQAVHDREINERDVLVRGQQSTIAAQEATIDQLRARVAELEAGQPQPQPEPEPRPTSPVGTVFGVDLSDLGLDANRAWTAKVEEHRILLQATGLGVVRHFAGGAPLGPDVWNQERLQALTAADDVHITTNVSTRAQRAGLKAMLAATPDKFRQRPGQVQWGVRHEMEADLTTQAAIDAWLADNLVLAEELDAADGYDSDDLVKTLLFYSQHVDYKGSWEKFHGGQDFGKIGMDCYHLQAQLNKVDATGKPAGSYTPASVLFGYLKTIKEQTGRPVCVPEWGGTLANTDPTGAGRAKAITDGAAFLRDLGATHASWWCADGSKDPKGNVRKHHLEQVAGANSPEVAAYRALMRT